MNKQINIAVIGCGNMASAVVLNLFKNNEKLHFYTYTPSATRAIELAQKVNGTQVDSLEELSKVSIDYFLIGHKPQQLNDFSKEYKKYFSGNAKIVSMLAATDIKMLESAFSTNEVIRIMPNTPIKVDGGITLLYSSESSSNAFKELITNHFNNAGLVVAKSERQLDELTVFAGCGPAYLFLFADTFAQKMQELGFSKDTSRTMLANLFDGSAKLMKNSDLPFVELLDQVTSKGGVTIEAVKEYRKHQLYDITSSAIDQALKRTDELAQEINK